jgi:hypothetical protein
MIGKLRRPHCLKNVTYLPFSYRTNQKVWMVSSLFTDWLHYLDRVVTRQCSIFAHPIKCPSCQSHHPSMPATKHISASADGPRCEHEGSFLQNLLHAYNTKENPKPINMLQAIHLILNSTGSVNQEGVAKLT